MMHILSLREVDFAEIVLIGLIAGYVMAIAGLWAGAVPGLVAFDIADIGRRYMVSDRPSAWLLGLASHLANSILLVLVWALIIVPNLPWPRPLAGLAWGLLLAVTLAGTLIVPLVTSLMSGLEGTWSAEGALAALAGLQATTRDDWRDAEPGKLPHEVRLGELAQRKIIPFFPAYYGTHDSPALYCLALWNAWCWTGDRALIKTHIETARAAMRWCDELGDRDGNGLLEYATRSSQGYRNQSWKDAGDAVVDADGRQAELPLATIELQGYLFTARLAMAELFAERGETNEANRMKQAASTQRRKHLHD